MQYALEDGFASVITIRDGQVVLEDELGISLCLCRINEVDESLQVAGIADIDARFCEIRFVLGTLDCLRKMEVDTRLMRIHLMIVVNHEGITWCYVHREHRLLDTRHGDAQLHAVAHS